MGTQPFPKKGQSPLPNFRPMSIVAKRLDGSTWPWRGGGPWSRPHCARWGPSFPPLKGDRAPNFRLIVIVAKLLDAPRSHLVGMDVCLSPGDFVLDGDQPPYPKRVAAPNFQPTSIVAKRAAWLKMPLGTEVGLGLRDIVLDGNAATSPLKGHSPQIFGQYPL